MLLINSFLLKLQFKKEIYIKDKLNIREYNEIYQKII